MSDLYRPFLAGLETSNFVIGVQLGDLKNEDAQRRARGDAGASISWIIGHLLSYRCMVLQACGVDQPNPYEETFSYEAPATGGENYPDIAELRAAWSEIHDKVREMLSGLSDEQILAQSELPSPTGGGTLLDGLSFLVWHESYHIGTIGMLRVQFGYQHTHERAMAAMES
ncbi:MAG: DinB family protein, partial [Acidobacteriota bacterium]